MLISGRFEVRAPRRSVILALSLAAGTLGCANPHAPSDWTRSPGLLIPTLSSTQTIAAPPQVRVGETFTITVNSMGSSTCVRADGMDVSRRGDVVDLVPWDVVAPSGHACTDDLRPFPHQTTITPQSAGSLTIRAHGLVLSGGGGKTLGTVVAVVTVTP
jgi:hypothetical protein